jgi:hypothetical protein
MLHSEPPCTAPASVSASRSPSAAARRIIVGMADIGDNLDQKEQLRLTQLSHGAG